MTWLVAGKPIASILVTRLRYLGDVAMTTVVCEALRAGDPDLRIGYLCEQSHGEILQGHPHLDRLHLLGVARSGADASARVERLPGTATKAGTSGQAVGTVAMVRELRQARYDAAVDLFFNPRSAWLLWLSGIGVRIGGTRKWRRRLYTHTVLSGGTGAASALAKIAPGGLSEHLGRLAPLTHAESGQDFISWVSQRFAPGELKPHLAAPDAGAMTTEPYLVLAPGATWPSKEWPLARWRALVAELAAGAGPRLKILIPPGKEQQWRELGTGMPEGRVEVLPALDLTAVKDLLASARGLLSVDGGVVHMSVALGTPTLALYGPTDPGIWFPYAKMGPYRVLAMAPPCHPCHRHQCDEFICLPDLTVQQVHTAAAELFDLAAVTDRGGSA